MVILVRFINNNLNLMIYERYVIYCVILTHGLTQAVIGSVIKVRMMRQWLDMLLTPA